MAFTPGSIANKYTASQPSKDASGFVSGSIASKYAGQANPATPVDNTSTVDKLGSFIGQPKLSTYIPDSLSQVKETILHPIKAIGNAISAGFNTIKGAFSNVINAPGNLPSDYTSNKPIANKVADFAHALGTDVGAIFSPVSAVFAAAEQVPVLKQAADVVNAVFTPVGKVGDFAAEKFIDVLPINQQSKDTLKPAFGEVGSLAAQLLLGGKVMDLVIKGVGLDNAKIDTITQEAKNEAVQAKTSAVQNNPHLSDNVISADKLKDINQDYNPANAQKYSQQAVAQFDEKLKTESNPVVRFSGGIPGAGKSDFLIPKLIEGHNGIVFDTTLTNYDAVMKLVQKTVDAGKKPELYYNIQDPLRAWQYASKRGIDTGRVVDSGYFATKASELKPTLLKLLNDHPDIEIRVKDLRNVFTKEDAINAPILDSVNNRKEVIDIANSLEYNKDTIASQIKNYEQTRNSTDQLQTQPTQTISPEGQGINRQNESINAGTSGENVRIPAQNGATEGLNTNQANKPLSQEGSGFVMSKEKLPDIKPITIQNDTKIGELKLQVDQLQQVVDESPLKALRQYESKQYPGELPEVTGEKGGNIFKQRGDQIMQETATKLGISEDQVPQAYAEYAKSGKKLAELKNELKNVKGESFKDYKPEDLQKINALAQEANQSISDLPKVAGRAKESGVSSRIESTAIEQGLSKKGIENLSEYQSTTHAEQAKRVADLMNNDFELAKKIIKGEEPAPRGLRTEALFSAMEDYAKKTGDVQLNMELAQSPIASEISAAGSKLSLSGLNDPLSPVNAIKDVMKAREDVISRKKFDITKEAKIDEVKIKEEIKKATPKKADWSSFIDSIKC